MWILLKKSPTGSEKDDDPRTKLAITDSVLVAITQIEVECCEKVVVL